MHEKNIYRRINAVLLGSGMCLGMLQIQPSFADQSDQLGEVVVTATRREANVQDVPISIHAMTNADLVRDQVIDIETLSKMAPNVDFRTGQSPFEQNISIRGIGGIKPVPSVDPPVAYYLDGVYQGLDQGSYNLIDMERVEVLEGPQGTLFGRNTVGGAISVTSNKPTDLLEGSIQGEWGNYGAQTYTAIVNDPIVPGKLDTRFVYQYSTNAGYGTNYTTGQPTASLAQNYFRGSARYTPNDKWEALVTYYSQESSGYGWPSLIHYVDPVKAPSMLPSLQSDNSFDINFPFDNRYYLDTYGATGTITGKLNDYLTVKSITGFISTKYSNRQDQTGESTGEGGTPLQHQLAYPTNGEQFSQELQVYGDVLDKRLSYIAGLYYGSLEANQVLYFSGSPSSPYARQNGPDADSKTYAGFAQFTYSITPKVRVTAGVRYTQDYRGVTFRSFFQEPYNGEWIGNFNSNPAPGYFVACGLPLPAGANYYDQTQCHMSSDVTYHYIPWTLGIDWKPGDDTLLYAKVSKSFRSGAYGNASPTYTPPGIPGYVPKTQEQLDALATYLQPVEPSSVLSPEIGAKADFLDHRLRINGALFYSWYDNVQANNSLPPACPLCGTFQSIVNSGDAQIWGGELEATALIEKLEIRLVGGYVHPQYMSGVYLGQKFAEISDINYMVGLTYPFDMTAGKLTLNTNWSWHSAEQQFSETPPIPNWAFTQPSWGLLDARATFEMANQPIEFSLYGSNLLDKAWFNSAVPNGAGWVNAYPSAPRLFGVSIKYKF